MKKFPFGIIILIIFTAIIVFIYKPFLQNTLNINAKDSTLIVLIAFISFSIGYFLSLIQNKFFRE